MGYLTDYYEKNKKKNPYVSSSTSNESSGGGYLTQYQKKHNLASPFESAPIKKVESKPVVREPIVQPVKTSKKPVEKSFFDKAKDFAGKVVEKADDLFRGRPKTISPVPTKKDEDVGAIETTLRQFKAGTGDMLYTAGSTAKWLGKDGIASKLQQQGMKYQSVAVDKTTGDFTADDLFDPAFYTQTLMRAVPFTVALLPAAIVGGYAAAGTAGALGLGALATTVLGSIGAAGLSRPLEGALEAGSAYDQAIQEGMTPEQAREVANKTFKGNLALSGMDAAEFLLAFAPLKGGGRFVKALQRTAGVAGGIAMEGSEEVIQSNIQRLAMDKDIDITSKQAQEEFAIGGIMGGGMSVAGAVYTKIQTNVEEEYKEEYDKKINEKLDKGVEHDVARIQALDEIAESHPKEVQEIVESTLEETIIPQQAETKEVSTGVETSSVKETKGVETLSSKSMSTIVQNVPNYQSAEDFADMEFSATPDQQMGLVDATTIEVRDPVDRNSPEYVALKEDIQQNGFKEPVRVTVEQGKKPLTTDGSQRTSVAVDLGVQVPVIVNEGSIEGLQTIADIYENGIMESNEQRSDDTGREPGQKELSDSTQVGAGKSRNAGKPTEKPSGQVARGGRGVSDGESGKRPSTSVKESARESAKDLISSYVKRGDTIKNLKDGRMGYGSPDGYSASIGGYVNGKKIPNDKIIVERVDGVDLEKPEIFSLKELYDEIKEESISETKQVQESDIPQAVTQDQLIQQAREWENVEDFIRSQNKLYHGTSTEFDTFDLSLSGEVQASDWGEGAYFTDNREHAKEFAKVAGGDIVLERYAPTVRYANGSDLLKDSKFMDVVSDDMGFSTPEEYLAPKGYDGLVFKNPQGFTEYVIYNVNKILTEAQLVDIWNQANRSEAERIIEDEIPQEVQPEIEEQLAEVEGDAVKEKAVVNKARKKATEYTEPVIQSAKQQVEVNQQIEELMARKAGQELTDSEKKLVKKYSGSGGLESAGAEGRGLLDEYFTPKPIVDFMWDKVLIEAQITKDSTILEPSVGIGAFLERVPRGARKIAFEINSTSAEITRSLYGDNLDISTDPFESLFMDTRGKKFPVTEIADLVIGNPPYGEHRGKYLGLGEEPKIVKYEEYFMKRGMDILKPNGVMAFIVPSGFMRSTQSYAKIQIAKQGKLLMAYRLPEGSFGTTTIGTDVLIFQKNTEGITEDETLELLRLDNYFSRNPQNVLGKVSKGTGRYGQDQVLGSLESAIRMAQGDPVEIEESIDTEEVQENVKEIIKEVEETVQETKSEPSNTSRSPKINKVNKGIQIVPNKKDSTMKLNNVPQEQVQMWRSVTVTGELDSMYTSKFNPKTFVSNDIAIDIQGNEIKYYPNILYYQGDIYDKIDSLELAKDKMSRKQYEIQRTGLLEVLPKPQTIGDINLSPISDFARGIKFTDELGQSRSVIDMFSSYVYNLPYQAFGSSNSWEIRGYLAGQVVNTGNKIQNIEIRKRRREVARSLFNRFFDEVLTTDQKRHIADRYNRTFNAYFRPDYRQVPILSEVNSTFKNKKLYVKDIQKEGAAFLATRGAGLLGYDVGVGKTLTSIIAINDVLKRGWAKKPLVVVPNGVYKNWINEISDIIPGVKINDLNNLGAGFKGDLASLEIEEGTISIITYSGLVKLGFKDETYQSLTADLQDVMTGMNTTKRGKAKEQAQIEATVGKAIKGTTDVRFFEDLGFDHITIDEVHNFKNVFAGAKIQKGTGNEFRNVRGSSSARGIKAYLMTQYVLKNNNDRNVFLLSATPFTNSPLEIYSILSLMGKKRLEQIGLKNVNDFMTMFMELKPTFVIKADQSVKEDDVIEKFQNLQQMQKLVTEFIDFRTGEEAGVDRPTRVKRTVSLNPNKLQQEYIKQAQPLFNDKQNGGAIVAITELQNTTLSPYLSRFNSAFPSYKELVENSPKIKYAIEGIAQNRKDKKNAGQVLYMPRGVQFFPLIKEYLIKEKGFAASEIGEITGGMTLDARMKVQTGFNSGSIKVLFGTEAIKEGINLQERSTDLFHLHLPWNPTDMLQVEGRIWRQGNEWKNVRIHYPLIENSVDSFIFQKLETKEKRIKDLWSYKDNEVSVGDLNFEDMKLDLITDPVLRVEASKTFETSKQRQKLEQLKVELAFVERRRESVQNAKDNMQQATESLKREKEKEEQDEYRLEYAQDRMSKAKKEFTRVQNILKATNMTVKDLDAKSADLTKQVEDQTELIKGLDATFAERLATAKEEKVVIGAKDNNYKSLISDIQKENKTFFIKKNETVASGDFKVSKPTEQTQASIDEKPSIQDIATSPEDLKKKIDQLNKFAQSNAILRRTGGLASKKAMGQFVKPGSAKAKRDVAKEGQVRLRGKSIANDADYVSVLAHELGHAIEYHMTGDTGKKTYKVFGDDLDTETLRMIREELIAITEELEGVDTVEENKKYYMKPSELLARFFEKMIVSPSNLDEIAPTANRLIQKQRIKHPMIDEFLEAVHGEIDKGMGRKFGGITDWFKDLRQMYQKHLGKRVGNIVYGQELAHRAMRERAKIVMQELVNNKFKGVKDDTGLLFRVAESIKVSKGGVPEFGTRDIQTAENEADEQRLKDMGYERVSTGIEGDETVPVYAKLRYTEEEGRAMFNQLSKEGKQLILDFTASREEAKDYFNRETIKETNKVAGHIEGWVHHYFESDTQKTGGLRLKFKEASTRKKRTGKEGYVEDFKKAMTKVLVDLETEKVSNDFLPRFFAGVTKPIPEGQKPDAGFVEVVGTLRKGVGLQREKTMLVVKDGQTFVPKQARYQMPKDIYERYKLWKDLADEATLASRVMNDINRYWRINILAHPGTAATNFESGAIQYASKILKDFYVEVLTGNAGMPQTKSNVSAMLKVLTPKGWAEAQDWVYGGDLSNYYGQFTEQPTVSKAISSYGDKALKLFSLYERYWKKVIATSEGASSLKGLNRMDKDGLRLLNKDERLLLAEINRQVDLYAYDYDNIPVWLARFGKNPIAQAVKPFAVYPYKYAKQITDMAGGVFDRSLPWQERTAKLLTLTTMVALYAMYSDERKKKQQTPEGTADTPARLSPKGRLFITEKDGKELFVRVAKYPFLNLSEAGMQFVNGEYESAVGLVNEMVGSVAPIGKITLLALGYKSPYETYDPAPVIIGRSLATYLPGYRIFNDVSRMLDPFQRKQRTFLQTFTAVIPTTDKDLQEKLHGEVRTEKVPIEGEIKGQEGTKRTTVDKTLKNYWQDIALSMLTGIYTTRIDPKDAEAYLIRSEKNKKEKDTDSKIDDYVSKYKDKPTISRKMDLERKLIEDIVGKGPYEKDRLKMKISVRTKFRNRIKEK